MDTVKTDYKVNCNECRYNTRPKHIYPCDKCKELGYVPITCDYCRFDCNKKGIRPCKDFMWD